MTWKFRNKWKKTKAHLAVRICNQFSIEFRFYAYMFKLYESIHGKNGGFNVEKKKLTAYDAWLLSYVRLWLFVFLSFLLFIANRKYCRVKYKKQHIILCNRKINHLAKANHSSTIETFIWTWKTTRNYILSTQITTLFIKSLSCVLESAHLTKVSMPISNDFWTIIIQNSC